MVQLERVATWTIQIVEGFKLNSVHWTRLCSAKKIDWNSTAFQERNWLLKDHSMPLLDRLIQTRCQSSRLNRLSSLNFDSYQPTKKDLLHLDYDPFDVFGAHTVDANRNRNLFVCRSSGVLTISRWLIFPVPILHVENYEHVLCSRTENSISLLNCDRWWALLWASQYEAIRSMKQTAMAFQWSPAGDFLVTPKQPNDLRLRSSH